MGIGRRRGVFWAINLPLSNNVWQIVPGIPILHQICHRGMSLTFKDTLRHVLSGGRGKLFLPSLPPGGGGIGVVGVGVGGVSWYVCSGNPPDWFMCLIFGSEYTLRCYTRTNTPTHPHTILHMNTHTHTYKRAPKHTGPQRSRSNMSSIMLQTLSVFSICFLF